MNTRNIIIGIAIFFGLGIVVAAIVGFMALGAPPASTTPITAIPLQANTATSQAPAATAEEQATTAYGSTDAAPAATEAAPAATEAAPATGGLTIYSMGAGSSANFTINEVLRGSPKEVVGTNDQVVGEIGVDLSDLSTAKVGVIQINAETFSTDEDRRNGAIRRFILNTDQFKLITFTPTEITGLSGAATVGQQFTFQVKGDLTIRDITQPAVFTVVAQADNDKQISGTATTTVKRADYSLTIPSVPFVADVSEDVVLTLVFVAPAK